MQQAMLIGPMIDPESGVVEVGFATGTTITNFTPEVARQIAAQLLWAADEVEVGRPGLSFPDFRRELKRQDEALSGWMK